MKITEKFKNSKGITLVALVVTIVILIILAGITIASLTGDNGLLGKVGEAKEQTDLAGIREEVALIWNEVQMEIAGKGYNNKEIAEIFEEKLKENDPDASVTYQSSNNTFEVDYKDHMFEVQPSGELTSNREEVIKDIEEAWENTDKDASGEDKAEQVEEELNKKDPDSTAEYNPETGNTDVNHGGYEAEVDEDGNVTIKGPEKDPNIDIDTDGDGEPDINIDTDGDGDPDINIDTDGDKKPDINIDTDGDGDPDINIDTDGDGDPDINIDTDGDGDPDINIDTDGDGDPDINIDTDGDGDPDINIDTDGDGDPDINIDTDDDGDPDINIDTDDDKDPDINIDTDGDRDPDINIDTDDDGDPDINIDTDDDKDPDINIDTDDDGDADINIDTDGDKDPDINIDTDDDGDPDINIDTDDDGDPDINIDTDGDKEPDINIDTDGDGDPDINIDTDGDKDPDINIDTDGDKEPDINIDTDDDGNPDINIDTDNDGDADINVDTDGDKEPDINIDTDDDGKPDLNIDDDGDGEPDRNIDTDDDGEPEVNIDDDLDGTIDRNEDTNDDGKPDINIDTDDDGKPDINIDTDGDKEPDINIDTDGDGKPDINIDTDNDGDADINIDTDGDKEPDINIDTDGDGKPDINIDVDGDGEPDVDIDTDGDKIPDKNVTKLAIVGQPQAVETISNASDVSFNVQATGAASAGSTEEEKITYQWYYNMANSNENGTAIEGATSSTYTIGKDNVTPSVSGRYYYCVVTQEYRGKTNVETTNTALLTVISPVEITKNPTSLQVIEGANDVTFEVTASGNGDISYQWYYKTSLEGAETQVIGATSNTYTIEKEEVTTELNGRYYYAKVIQSYGMSVATATSSEGLLTVAERANIIQEPSSTTVTEGKDAKFTVAAIGVGDISYQWYKSNTNETNGTEIAGETEETLTIDNVTAEDNDTYYYVVITQKYGTSTVEITSNVARLTVGDGVSVSTPNDVNVIEGITDVTFSVEANGSGTFSYQWYRNTTDSNEGGTPIDTATGNSYTIRKEDVTIDLNNTYYYVEVTQNFGGNTSTVKSEPAALSVIAKATIGVQPNPVTAYEKGQNVIFSVETIGDGQLTYQWYKNTEESNEGGEAIPSATGNSYTIEKENVTQDLNNTYYYVEITQKYGSSTVTVKTEAAQLTVMGTGIEASETDVTVYVNGTSKTVTLSGENAGAFSIETPANETYARAEINQDNNNELIITPVAAGETSVTVIEGNGGKTLTINITVLGTTIVADPQNVTAYVGGSNQTVALGGENSGTFTIETEPEATVATASISGNILTIKPVGVGSTSVTVKELNGNKTTTVNVEVKETSIDANNKDVTLYVGGAKGTVTITGTELGTLSIEKAPDGLYATAEINPDNNKELIITPVGAGSTNVVVKEGNGNNTVTININVLATTITASPESVIAYVDGSNQTVTLSGENAGAFSIEKQPEGYATASIQGNTLTIEPKAAGKTSVTVREANGGKTVEIPIEVRQTSIGATSTDITAYVGGADQNVSISGTYMGELSISKEPEEGVATVSLGDNNVLTIHPVGEGQTSVEVKEANGNKTITINIRVIRSNMTATSTNVTAYVGGTDQTVEIQGIDIGELSISKEPEEGVATVNLQGSTLTIKPVGDGKTSVEVKEANGNNTVTINITVITPSITEQTVEVYAGGASKQVTITGLHMGTLTIEEGPDSTYATASIEGTTLTVVPTQTAGNTSLLLKEANGNQTARINITVIATGIDASEKDLELYVGGANKQVEISGTNAGELSVSRQPDTGIATASLSGNILTITPKAAGSTNVVVKEANGNKTVTININVLATTITASPESVIAYVNGTNQTVTLGGENAGAFSIEKQPESYATASIQGNTLTIEPKSAGTTSVTVREANGNQTKEIPIEVRQTSIEATNTNVTAYVGGSNQEVEITGTYLGELSIETPADESYAKVSLEGNTLTIEPKAVGKTSVTIKEGNGNRTVTININVIASNITVDNPNVTAYVGGSDRTATISGDSLGALSISGNPNSKVATASLSGNTITIKPVGEGETSVTVREANGNKTVTVSIKVLATSINTQSIEVYAGGTAKTVTITGQSMGTLTIEEGPDSRYATAQINGTSLTVTPVAAGSTKLTLKEANGNQTATINITVTATSIDANNKDVTLYVGGNSKTVTISGENTGAFSIERQPNEGVATASIQNNILTIVPKAAGSTSVVVKEGNGNKTVTINVTVLATTITANPESVIAYVNGTNQTVTLGGENAGAFSIEKQPEGYATASIQGNTLTIEPKAAGKTSVTVREANGEKTVEIPIEVRQTSIGATNTNVTAYVGGSNQEVTITGTYLGNLSIEKQPTASVATVSLDGTTLTITPKAAGDTSVVVKEGNGNRTVTINIHVIQSNITATSTSVTGYVGGVNQTVTIQGTDIGTLSIETPPTETVATASLQGNTLTIKPVGDGKTSVTVKEANGNNTVTIEITVLATSITPQSVEVYEGGAAKTVEIQGLNMGALEITTPPEEGIATAQISGTSLTVTPVKAGNTELTLKEANGNQTATINITVTATSIDANNKNVTVYVGGDSKTVEITGENAGTLSIGTPADGTHATASLQGNIVTISPVTAGTTSVTIKEGNGNKTVTINIEVKATSIDANNKNVLAYVGGNKQTVTITGTEMGELSISGQPNTSYATAELQGSTLTITPVAAGKTSVTVREANGKQTVTINIEVRATSIDANNKNVIAYVGGVNPQVTITGTEMGTLSIEKQADGAVATVSLQGSTLTITPKAAGKTSVIVKEGNGNKTVTINIEVKATSIDANNKNVTAYVGGVNPQITITGTNAGAFSIETPADGVHAATELSDGILTIIPKAAGKTSVTIKEANGNKTVTINITVLETTLEATNTNVIAYIGGTNPQVTINGDNLGTLSIVTPSTETIARTSLQGRTLTITPVAAGKTSVTIKEANGNKEVTINIEVKATSMTATNTNVIAYVGGVNPQVTINGDNLGTLSIVTPSTETIAKTSLQGRTLTITPVAAGKTSVKIKEANGNKEVTINIEVRQTSMTATSTNVTAYVGGSNQEVTITGTYLGNLSIEKQPTANVATVSLEGTKLIIHPVGKGTTNVTIKEANGNKLVTINIEVIESTLTATMTNVELYVGGSSKTVGIQGTDMGKLSIETHPTGSVATASLQGSTLTITPVGAGSTNVVVKEGNGNKTVTIKITVLATSITPQSIELYAGGVDKTIKIEGLNMGTLTIENGPDTTKATASISGTSLTVTPVAAGTTSLTLKETNGNKTATISITVLATSITATPSSVTTDIGQTQTVTLSGTNAGEFSIVTPSEESIAKASISGSTLTIVPVGAGETSVVVKEGNGNKETTISITINAGISAPNVPGTDYGATVNGYDCSSAGVNNWLLFYSDDENIYLIADDYIPYKNIPSNSVGHKPDKGNYPRSAYFDKEVLLNDYSGSGSITDPRLQALNNDYFTKNYSSTNYNMKAVAYMLDTNAWGGYAGEKAEYAVGGPSIEMLMASYSEKYGVDYRAQASSRIGYRISTNGGSTWEDYMSSSSEYLNSSDRTYVINSTSNAWGYWIASPSDSAGSDLVGVSLMRRCKLELLR